MSWRIASLEGEAFVIVKSLLRAAVSPVADALNLNVPTVLTRTCGKVADTEVAEGEMVITPVVAIACSESVDETR